MHAFRLVVKRECCGELSCLEAGHAALWRAQSCIRVGGKRVLEGPVGPPEGALAVAAVGCDPQQFRLECSAARRAGM
jgi:hypothetical protein